MSKAKRARQLPEVRRQHIVDQAIRLVGEQGYGGFTVEELAERCKLSKGGLLHHFRSKGDLLVALIDEMQRLEGQVITPLLEAALPDDHTSVSRESVIALLQAILTLASSNPELGRLFVRLQMETLDPAHPAHDTFKNREQGVLDLFTLLIEPFVDEPRSTARRLSALIDGLTQQWLRADQSFDLLLEWRRAIEALLPDRQRKGN